MTLREAIVAGMKEWGHTDPEAHCPSQVAKIEHAVSLWMVEQDCRLDQLIALARADLRPMLRNSDDGFLGKPVDGKRVTGTSRWNLQLSPEAGHLIDFDGATLEDVLQEACAKYLSKEATT